MSKRILLLFVLFCTHLQAQNDEYKYELSICALFQNEARFLKEWIDYHRLVGVDHFYLFNNLSTDNYKCVLQPYINAGIVELFEWPHQSDTVAQWNDIQCRAYKKGLDLTRGISHWLAIIDSDEFIVPVIENSLLEILSEFTNYGGLGVNWQMYGTSGVSEIPSDRLLIDMLLMKAPADYGENIHIKSIVQPNRVESCHSPHYVKYKEGFFAVNENAQKCRGPFNRSISISKIRINHYWVRDEEFLYQVKIPRNTKWWGNTVESILNRVNRMNLEYDPIMLRFVDQLQNHR